MKYYNRLGISILWLLFSSIFGCNIFTPNDNKKGDEPVCTATKEICNGKDDDCDGYIDKSLGPSSEMLPLMKECYSGKPDELKHTSNSLCKAGKQLCILGVWLRCEGEQLPKKEMCNGKDDDCNGLIDEYSSDWPLCPVGQECKNGICVIGSEGTRCEYMGRIISVNLKYNPDHCGSCNNKCSSGQRCLDGKCQSN